MGLDVGCGRIRCGVRCGRGWGVWDELIGKEYREGMKGSSIIII